MWLLLVQSFRVIAITMGEFQGLNLYNFRTCKILTCSVISIAGCVFWCTSCTTHYRESWSFIVIKAEKINAGSKLKWGLYHNQPNCKRYFLHPWKGGKVFISKMGSHKLAVGNGYIRLRTYSHPDSYHNSCLIIYIPYEKLAILLGTCKKAKPVNTGSQKYVSKLLNANKLMLWCF